MELDESQCKCDESLHSDGRLFVFFSSYYVTHYRVNVFLFSPCIAVFLFSPCIAVFLFPKSGDFASGNMTVSFRVWLSGRDDFRREWYNSTVVWVKIIYSFVIRGCYLLFTM